MKRQKFSLQAVLDFRETRQKQAEEAFAIAIQACERAARDHRQALEEHARLAQEIMQERFTAATRGQGWNALQVQEQFCRQQFTRLQNAQQEATAKRELLAKASQERELVERLKEKWLRARIVEEQRKEEQTVEEFVMARRAVAMTQNS